MGGWDADLALFPDEYVPNVESVPFHGRWARANPGEAAKWVAFRDALIATGNGAVPVMATKYGRALVAAGKEHMSITQLVGAMVPSPPIPPDPPIAVTPTVVLPTLITTGGVYSGTHTGTIQIRTSLPVTITDSVITNTGTGYVIDAVQAGLQLTLRRCTINGGTGQAVNTLGHKSLLMESCTINKTWGVLAYAAQAGATVRITKCRFVNQVFDQPTNGNGFWVPHSIQISEGFANHASLQIDWNEFINDYAQSRVEDVISLWKSGNAWIHDNGIKGAYGTTATSDVTGGNYAGGGIMMGDGGGSDSLCEDNIIVKTANHCLGILGGANNRFLRNKMAHDSRTDDGTLITSQSSGGLGIQIWNLYNAAGFINNVADGNTIGVTKNDGTRNDYWLATPGNGNDIRNTTLIRAGQTIVKADEDTLWLEWLAKLASNGVVVGAP